MLNKQYDSVIPGRRSSRAVEMVFEQCLDRRPRLLSVLDLTYGFNRRTGKPGGGFWRWEWRRIIHRLTANDIAFPPEITARPFGSGDANELPVDVVLRQDFRDTDIPDASFDVVVFDPPFSAMGQSSDGVDGHADNYGAGRTTGGPQRYDAVAHDIVAGTIEACRLAREAVVVKVMNTVESGRYGDSEWLVATAMMVAGFHREDTAYLPAGGRRQPTHSKATGEPLGRNFEHFNNTVSAFMVGRPGAPKDRFSNTAMAMLRPMDYPWADGAVRDGAPANWPGDVVT